MKYLLDTHVFLWMISDPKKLSKKSRLLINIKHALNIYNLPLFHKDPFDRMIVSQSLIENIPIITADLEIKKYPIHVIW
jgi:PIN domain nuclease of toxin-antitoxin system